MVVVTAVVVVVVVVAVGVACGGCGCGCGCAGGGVRQSTASIARRSEPTRHQSITTWVMVRVRVKG